MKANPDPPNTVPPGQMFVDTVTAMRGGDLVAELAAALKEVVASVHATRKKGSLTLKITVSQMKDAETGMLLFADDLKKTLPVGDKQSSFFFGSPEGKVSRRDPRQPELADLGPGAVTRPARALAEVLAGPGTAPAAGKAETQP